MLNFNVLVPLALISLPALAVTYVTDRKRLGILRPLADQSSPFTVLALRLAPFYLWLSILTLQPHKEERFMYPAYPLLCFNAAVSVYLMRGWLETAFIKLTNSPYRVSLDEQISVLANAIGIGLSITHLPQLYFFHCCWIDHSFGIPHLRSLALLSFSVDHLPRFPDGRTSASP